jgi:hypothetical protein
MAIVLIAALMVSIGSCEATPRRTGATKPPANGNAANNPAPLDTQASAARLHEIAGCLLLYHVKHGRLPQKLSALRDDPSLNCPPLVSPDNGKAYVYHNPPLHMAARPGALLIHDPGVYAPASESFGEPVHWALLIDDESLHGTLGTQVIFVAAREIQSAGARP